MSARIAACHSGLCRGGRVDGLAARFPLAAFGEHPWSADLNQAGTAADEVVLGLPPICPNGPPNAPKSVNVIAFLIIAIRGRPAHARRSLGGLSVVCRPLSSKLITSVTCFTPSPSSRGSRHDLYRGAQGRQPPDLWTQVSVAGVKYLRLPLHTHWLDETDDLVLALKEP